MKIVQLQLYVLMCCQAAVADQLTDLGSNLSINCDLDEHDVYWILLKTPDPPIVILRSFSASQSSPVYYNNTFRKKYSLQRKHRLVINNVTADELGVYYCMNTGKQPKFSNITKLGSAHITECHNHTVVEFIDQNQTQWQIIIIIIGLLFGLLIIVLIGINIFTIKQRRSPERSTQLQMRVLEEQQELEQLQYADVDFSKLHRNIRSSQNNCTYAALKPPKS